MRKKVVVSFKCSFLQSQRRKIVRILCESDGLCCAFFINCVTFFFKLNVFFKFRLYSNFGFHFHFSCKDGAVPRHRATVREGDVIDYACIDSSSTKVISFMFIWVRQGLGHTGTVDYSAICDSHCEFSIGNWEAELCSKTIREPISFKT
jgi:hypothetical protein